MKKKKVLPDLLQKQGRSSYGSLSEAEKHTHFILLIDTADLHFVCGGFYFEVGEVGKQIRTRICFLISFSR